MNANVNTNINEVANDMKKNFFTVYENKRFGTIRSVVKDGEPWFVGKDVAEALGYTGIAKAVREHVDENDKGVSVLDTPGGKQNMTIIKMIIYS